MTAHWTSELGMDIERETGHSKNIHDSPFKTFHGLKFQPLCHSPKAALWSGSVSLTFLQTYSVHPFSKLRSHKVPTSYPMSHFPFKLSRVPNPKNVSKRGHSFSPGIFATGTTHFIAISSHVYIFLCMCINTNGCHIAWHCRGHRGH